MHGFDEFYGNLYHLNAEEEPELPNWPPASDFPNFSERFGPRGVIRSWATDEDDPTEEGRFGRVGRQRIEDTGPLTKKRMETIDDDTVDAAKDFIRRQHAAGTPFFVWMNTTHMHLKTHPKPESVGQAGRWQSPYHDTMIDHDKHGRAARPARPARHRRRHHRGLLHRQRPPHEHLAGRRDDPVPQREEHQLGGRLPVPEMVRWPNRIPAGVVSNEIVGHHDWLPTFLAAAGEPTSSRSSRPATPSATGPTGSTSTATTSCPT